MAGGRRRWLQRRSGRVTFCEEMSGLRRWAATPRWVALIAGDNVVEVAGQFCRDLVRACGDVLGGFGQVAVRVVVVIDRLVEGLVVVRAGCEIVVPVVFIVIGALEEVGGIFGGGHNGDASSV